MFQGGFHNVSGLIVCSLLFILLTGSSVLDGKSPYELVYKKKPELSHLRYFECLCFQPVLNNHDKLTSRSNKCVLIGYSSVKKANKLFNLDNRSVARSLMVFLLLK